MNFKNKNELSNNRNKTTTEKKSIKQKSFENQWEVDRL